MEHGGERLLLAGAVGVGRQSAGKDVEQRILRLRFGLDGCAEHILEEVGKILGMSREREGQIEARRSRSWATLPRPQACYF